MSNDEDSVSGMYRKMLLHPRVQASPGSKRYIEDQLELVTRELPPPACGEVGVTPSTKAPTTKP
jgi:hypothetical protein